MYQTRTKRFLGTIVPGTYLVKLVMQPERNEENQLVTPERLVIGNSIRVTWIDKTNANGEILESLSSHFRFQTAIPALGEKWVLST